MELITGLIWFIASTEVFYVELQRHGGREEHRKVCGGFDGRRGPLFDVAKRYGTCLRHSLNLFTRYTDNVTSTPGAYCIAKVIR